MNTENILAAAKVRAIREGDGEGFVLVPMPQPYTTTVIDGVTYVLMAPAILRTALAASPIPTTGGDKE